MQWCCDEPSSRPRQLLCGGRSTLPDQAGESLRSLAQNCDESKTVQGRLGAAGRLG